MIDPSIDPSIKRSINRSGNPLIHWSIHPSICRPILQSIDPSVYPLCPSIHHLSSVYLVRLSDLCAASMRPCVRLLWPPVAQVWNALTQCEKSDGMEIRADVCCLSRDARHVGLLRRHDNGTTVWWRRCGLMSNYVDHLLLFRHDNSMSCLQLQSIEGHGF